MSQLHESGHDDQELVRYLLGLMPGEEAERLDELSITDDDLAWRLRAVENDLVDAYVGGALTGETLERFESFYLSSPRRREKVTAARTFLSAIDRDASTHPAGRPEVAGAVAALKSSPTVRLMAVAALGILTCGAVVLHETRLRSGLNEAHRESAALDRRAHELEQQLSDQRAANAEAVKELERVRQSLAVLAEQSAAVKVRERAEPDSPPLSATALVLLPQTRAIGSIPTLDLPRSTDRVTIDLRLESNEFPHYEAALKDPATNQVVWRSGQIAPRFPDRMPTVSIVVPASVLKSQHYAFELIGRRASGGTEVVGSYAVRIVSR
jgi:hypothetical protein